MIHTFIIVIYGIEKKIFKTPSAEFDGRMHAGWLLAVYDQD